VRTYFENTKKRVGGVAQGLCPEFKPQYCKKPKNKKQKPTKTKKIKPKNRPTIGFRDT
jgi:hypothetical protein